jgi:hypothetical protein
MLIVLIYIDIYRIFTPNLYLQRYAGYHTDILSVQKVKVALYFGADPNFKISSETPFFISYYLENDELVELMLPFMECGNLERVLIAEKKSSYHKVVSQFNRKCLDR